MYVEDLSCRHFKATAFLVQVFHYIFHYIVIIVYCSTFLRLGLYPVHVTILHTLARFY